MENKIDAIAIGVNKTNKNTFIKNCPFNVLIERGEDKVKIKENDFTEYLIDTYPSKKDIEDFCKKYSKKYKDHVYYNNRVSYSENFDKYGFTLFKPDGKSFFTAFGMYDKECQIYFPINNIKSNVINKIIFYPLQLELPTNEDDLKNAIIDYETLDNSIVVKKEIKEILTILYNASMIYPSKLIWKGGKLPPFIKDIYSTSFINFKSALDFMTEDQLMSLPIPISKNDLFENYYRIQNMNKKEKNDIKNATISLITNKYKNITENSLKDFGLLLSDLIKNKDSNMLYGLQHFFHDTNVDLVSSINIKNNVLLWSFLSKSV